MGGNMGGTIGGMTRSGNREKTQEDLSKQIIGEQKRGLLVTGTNSNAFYCSFSTSFLFSDAAGRERDMDDGMRYTDLLHALDGVWMFSVPHRLIGGVTLGGGSAARSLLRFLALPLCPKWSTRIGAAQGLQIHMPYM